MKSIPTSVPGVRFGEGLPRLAGIDGQAHRGALADAPLPVPPRPLRRLGHPRRQHQGRGRPQRPRASGRSSGRSWTTWTSGGASRPCRRCRGTSPCRSGCTPRSNFRLLGGPYAGFLGSRYDPVWTEFSRKGTKPVPNQAGRAGPVRPVRRHPADGRVRARRPGRARGPDSRAGRPAPLPAAASSTGPAGAGPDRGGPAVRPLPGAGLLPPHLAPAGPGPGRGAGAAGRCGSGTA